MEPVNYILPQVQEFRRHLCSCLLYVYMFIGYNREFDEKEYPYLNALVDIDELQRLRNRIELMGNEYLEHTKQEVLTIYACHDIMTKLLVTKAGERIAELILEKVKPGSKLKKFKDYRDYYIKINLHMISDIEKNLGTDADLRGLKARLAALAITLIDE